MRLNDETERQRFERDDAALFWGALLGFVTAAIYWLFNVPQRGVVTRRRIQRAPDELREQIAQQDAVTNSLDEGKAIARRRRPYTED